MFLDKEPFWRRLFSARKDLNLTSLSPDNLHNYIERIDNDEEAFIHYYYLYHGASTESPHCDLICKRRIVCNLQSSQSHMSKEFCNKFVKTWSYYNPISWFRYWFYQDRTRSTLVFLFQIVFEKVLFIDYFLGSEKEPTSLLNLCFKSFLILYIIERDYFLDLLF